MDRIQKTIHSANAKKGAVCERAVLPAEAKSFGPWLSSMCVATSVAVTAITGLQPISAVTLKGTNIFTHCKERGTINHNTRIIKTLETPAGIHVCEVYAIHTSAALLPVLGPSLSNTLGRRGGGGGVAGAAGRGAAAVRYGL